MVVLSRPNGHGPVTAACESRSPPRGSRRAPRCDAIAFSPGRLADRTHYSFRRMVEMYSTLFPRMKQSPYFALSCPFTYSGASAASASCAASGGQSGAARSDSDMAPARPGSRPRKRAFPAEPDRDAGNENGECLCRTFEERG